MGKRNIEKSLKRFLKRKISYTFALWVVFMITGGIAFGAPVTMGDNQKINREIQETKSDLLTKIQIEKDKIKKKIFENEKLIKKYNSNAEELVKKGNFYSKSLVNSTQVFFYYQHLSNEELKDKTDKEFAETIDAINKYLGNESGKTLLKSTGNIAIDKITSGNGVAVDLEGFRETIEIGANIKPVEPELPVINSDISVSPTAPNIVLGILPETVTPNISFPTDILVPNIILQTPPDSINITVALPEAVDKLAINLGDIEGPKFPDEKDIAILEVATPNPINPTTISIPEIPSSPEILLPRTPSFNLTSISLGNGDRVFIDAVSDASGTEENAIISNVAVIGGDFKIKREEVGNGDSNNNNSFTYSYTGYKVLPYLSLAFSSGVDVDKDGNPINDLDTVYEIKDTNGKKSFWSSYTGGTGVQKLVNNYGMLTNGNFTVTRESKNENTNLGEFVHIDLHSNTWKIANMQNILDSITNKIPEDKNKIMTAWNSASNQAAYEHGMYWLNNGKIILEGGNLSITNQYTHTPHGIPEADQNSQSLLVINTGSLEIRPYKSQDGSIYDSYNSVFLISNDTNRDAQHIWYNSGEIKTYTTDTAIFTINSDNNSNTANKIDVVIDNKGKIEMTGNKSVGVYAKAAKSYDHVDSDGKNYTFGSLKMNFADDDNGTNRKPIVLYGDNSIGLYVLEKFRPSNEKISGNFHVDIGDTSGQANKLINIDSRETNGGLSINDYEGENIDLETIDGSIGILSHNGMNLSSHGINIYENTKDSIGVVPLRGTSVSTVPTLELGKGSIELLGGENNIGILAMNFYNGAALTHKGGNVLTKGSVVLSKGNKNVGIIAKEGYKVSVKELKTIGEAAANAIGIYGDGNGTSIVVEEGVKNLKLKVDSPTNTNTVNAVAAYSSNGAKITMNKLSLNNSLDIEVTGAKVSGEEKSYRGIGLMASDGTIEAQKTNIKVSNGATGIVSLGIDGFIDLKGGQLEVDNGYAVYSDGNGKVDIRNAKIILNGNTIAFDLDPNVLSPIIFDETTNIHIKSNDVVVFNVKNLTFSNISELKSTILSGANINITSEIGVTKYLEAVLEGTTLNFDIALNKSSVDNTNAGFYYFNRILAQNSILNVNNTINAQLASTSTENALGADNYKEQVIGLEMNATKKAISNASTQINISSTGAIKAERTDSAGSGAIGAFINYGILTNEIGGKIEVQKTYSCAGGIGIYSVNGSKVVNSGTVEVGGNNAIGILGMAYREDSTGTPVINEFGTLAIGQGKVNISNSGSVTLKGTGTIGIYAWNNNSTGTKADNIVTNTTTGKIIVGNSTVTNTSVGIYGEKATISNLGKVSVGDGGVA
ncbi:autotransporter-associated N-terminal domain-containing protein, partial [Fusobacterium ulcerans]|uniref:autotransporter-associated N-terminal domain-containing protein n=1 Tax=Fusobacterium ulcerans TaxID=861 RepID=UPI001D0B56A2